jgi:CxxC-x17-CxxC domain-containing protein
MNNQNQITLFAETNFRGQRKKFGIKTDDRRRHMYLIGKTGMGKTTALENMIISDINIGRGVAVIDPHGDLVEKIADFIPSNRINDTIYFNPADLDWPIAFNILETVDPTQRHLVASGLVGVFKKIWAESWGPRLEYLLRNAILALLEYPGASLLGVTRLLIDRNYRKKVIDKVTDPVVQSFWIEEYTKYHDRLMAEAIAPIQNKVGQFLSNFLIRNIVGQVKSSIDVREVMDNQKILLMNLAKGRIGEDTSALLGAMIITKIQLAAMERVDIPEEQRKDFYLYVDEFQNFATESFADILSEARKYRLNLIVAHQYIEQLDEKVRAAIFGNVGTLMCWRVGAEDAEELAKEFAPQFTETDLVNLAKYDVYMKLMIDGVASQPFSATNLPPLYKKPVEKGSKEKIIKVTRERYTESREEVERKIRKWSGREEEVKSEKHILNRDEGEKVQSQNMKIDFLKRGESRIRNQEKEKKEGEEKREKEERIVEQREEGPYGGKTKVSCDVCSRPVFIGFKPDEKRPIYCKKCLKRAKRGELPLDHKPNREEIERLEN